MIDRYPIGASAAHTWTIDETLTVRAHGTVDLPVLATPQLIFMLEDTCVLAVNPLLEAGKLTIGTAVHVDHLAAARIGDQVHVRAELVAVRGRRLVFRVEGRSGSIVVARGLHERAIVDKKKFEAALARSDNVMELPKDLPVPQDDGACNHLIGMKLPALTLASTRGRQVDLSQLRGTTVVYIYPRTGRPDQELPTGWNAIPGARGCTPQSCAFRDHYQELKNLGVGELFGLSTQNSAYQQEAAARLHLPFELLSDERLEFAQALTLPMFEVDGMQLIKRITLIVRDGKIVKVFYPVFPPDRNADDVTAWLRSSR